MSNAQIQSSLIKRAKWQAYLELCKPRVVALMLLTSLVGMLLATPYIVPWQILIFGNLGIGLAACAGAVLNHIVDRHIDALMRRTEKRPLPTGIVSTKNAFIFAVVLALLSVFILVTWVNGLTAVLSIAALVGYALIYTVILKRTTPQNIVIGGLAGAMPPLMGWTAVTGHVDPYSLLLVLIIFAWTPPHFWALAIYRYEDYAKVNIPMLPVIYGVRFTKLHVLLYTFILVAASLMPFVVDMSGIIYLGGAILLNAGFLYFAIKLLLTHDPKVALNTFSYSIFYLMILFLFLLVDHYLPVLT